MSAEGKYEYVPTVSSSVANSLTPEYVQHGTAGFLTGQDLASLRGVSKTSGLDPKVTRSQSCETLTNKGKQCPRTARISNGPHCWGFCTQHWKIWIQEFLHALNRRMT